jgi:carbonic anhydrase/acetyltransferase-like protein (isoleucine patch superfamily)
MFVEYRGRSPRVATSAFIAPTAVLIGDVFIGEGASIWFGVVLRADDGEIRVGPHSSIEDNAVVHASTGGATIVGSDVTVGHGAVLDDCTIGDGALIGSNAVVLAGAIVGGSSVVGAGSVVTVDARIAERIVAAGSPAKPRKALAGGAASWIEHGTRASLAQAQAYRRDNIGDPQHHEFKSATRRKLRPSAVT